MQHLTKAIVDIFVSLIEWLGEDTAEALERGNRLRVVRNIVIVVGSVLCALGVVALLVCLIYWGRHILAPIVGGLLLCALLVASYRENHKPVPVSPHAMTQAEKALLYERAEAVYEFVRDAMYQVFCAASQYTAVIRPTSPSAVETQTRFFFNEAVPVFQFTAMTGEHVDALQLKDDFQRILAQKLRAQELMGLPTRLVTYEGRTYLPIQIINATNCGASVIVDVVFANEKSIPLIEAKKRIQFEQRGMRAGEVPSDADF